MWTVFWHSLVLAVAGTIILRLGGRKSISQMTIPQLAILLALGTILGSEVSGKGLFESVLAAGTFVGFLVLTEWATLKWNIAESVIRGKSVRVIADGKILTDQLRSLRLTVDDLEKRLRIAGISRIEDVKTGTIEANGELGYELMDYARPVTLGDLEKLLKNTSMKAPENKGTIFSEITDKSGQQNHEYLQ
ncbi:MULTISPECIES: DUF421 domain-containing protein [Heyndrickxia]|jgi:uncharacterized membrane protein YcaP (DUF421 family)|uniref:DUF421 domain-containing protein n=1 Tax=Heyndrickxia TaxID=2837504 RepID=UPI001A94867B|nr:YetF domain-containing protein [Heyndrickxia coagulans]MED4344625.1 DUF421 domain-containing protein [Heyndrickxia coagulans]